MSETKSWQEILDEMLAGCPADVQERIADWLDETNMQRHAALYALDLVVRAIYSAQEALSQAGILLPIDQEREEQRQRDIEMMAEAERERREDVRIRAKARRVLAKDAAEYRGDIASGRLESDAEQEAAAAREADEAFVNAAATEILERTEWEE